MCIPISPFNGPRLKYFKVKIFPLGVAFKTRPMASNRLPLLGFKYRVKNSDLASRLIIG